MSVAQNREIFQPDLREKARKKMRSGVGYLGFGFGI